MLMTRELLRSGDDRIASRPLCPNCGRPMHLDRITPRTGGLPGLHSYKCGECGVWTNKAAEVEC